MNAKTLLFAALAALTVAPAFAEMKKPAPPKGMSIEEANSNRLARIRQKEAEKAKEVAAAGGYVEKPGVARGSVCFIDTQTVLPATNILAAVKTLDPSLRKYDIVVEAMKPGKPADLKKAAKATVAVIAVYDDETPGLLVAPDEGWAVVNFKKCAETLKGETAMNRFFASRCKKQLVRAFAFVAGGFYSSFPNNIMDVSDQTSLDLCNGRMPMDKIVAARKYFAAHGMVPRKIVTYDVACEQGWAPPPTNDVQKAVWEESRRLPDKPIEIKFDPKKGK